MQGRVHGLFATQHIGRLISHRLKLNFAHVKHAARQSCIGLPNQQPHASAQL